MLPPFLIDLLKQLAGLLGAALITFLIGKFPDFPIPKEVFINFIVWLVLSLLGVNAAAHYTKKVIAKRKR